MKKRKIRQLDDQGRRDFLRGSLAAGAGVVSVAAAPGVALAGVEESGDKPDGKRGYRLSQHILDYYKTAAS